MASELFVKMTDILPAIFNCDLRKLKVFLPDNRKINYEIPGTEGCTPLHLLVGVDNVNEKDQVLSYFLEIGADPNARSYDDLTPVHIAAMWNNCSELEKLLQSGGNPWLTDNENKNAFDLAIDNHAYEAYQLLHKYLSEDKLNFRVRIMPSNTTPSYCKQNNLLNTGMIKDTVYSKYFSTHENFPLYFSSSTDEDSAESFLNVSRILKKDLTKSRSTEQKNYSRPNDPEKVASNKGLLSDICSNKYSSDCSEVPKERVCNSEFLSDICSNKYSSDCSEVPKEKVCHSEFFSAIGSNKYSSDCSEVSEKKVCHSEFFSAIGSNKYSSGCSEVSEKKVCHSEFLSIGSDKYSSDCSEISENKVCNSEFLSNICSDKYSNDCIEVPKEKVCNSKIPSTSDDTEIYTTSENEYIIPEENVKENSETIIETDNKSGIVLVAISASSLDFSSVKICNMSDCDSYATNDWRSFHSQSTSCLSEKSCNSHSTSVFIPPDYRKLSNIEIYTQLKNLGDNPGPVSNSTREIYLRRLARLKSGCKTSCVLPKPKYCNEVYMFLEGKFDGDRIQNMINAMSAEFNTQDPKQKWREGNQRCCFNYFLLDPRVTQNLPSRLKLLTYEKAFLTFLDALFYVGKGMRARPYSHLLEAAKAAKDMQWKSNKINHILDIWESGHGVISLHCFNNCIPVEAYTQEASIIDAVGLENLTNIKNGNYYGVAAKWKWSWKRKVGVELLHRALQIFILEGEKQIMPKDVRTK